MKPLFTIHAGEYLVAEHIERAHPRWNVWVPSKDTGIDLQVVKSGRCWEARGLSKADQELVALDRFIDRDRDFTEFLDAWKPVAARLK